MQHTYPLKNQNTYLAVSTIFNHQPCSHQTSEEAAVRFFWHFRILRRKLISSNALNEDPSSKNLLSSFTGMELHEYLLLLNLLFLEISQASIVNHYYKEHKEIILSTFILSAQNASFALGSISKAADTLAQVSFNGKSLDYLNQ